MLSLSRIASVDLTMISDKSYFYEEKRRFLLNDFRYKGAEGEQQVDLELDNITMFSDNIDVEEAEEVTLNFFEDYLKKAAKLSADGYLKSFLEGLETIKNYTPEAIQNHFNQHEINIKNTISEINSVSILKTNKFNEFVESLLQSILDEINTIKSI